MRFKKEAMSRELLSDPLPCGASSSDASSEEFVEMIEAELPKRVGDKRLKHIHGVADCAKELAEIYGIDANKAYLAGLLHDWDKGMGNEAIRLRAESLGIEDEIGRWVIDNMPEVMHGPTAACALKRQFPQIPDDVIRAIEVHTTACKNMSDLDKVIYIADAIEPGRKFKELGHLRSLIGESSLDDLYFEVYKYWIEALLSKERALHPQTIDIWNHYCSERKKNKRD